MRSEFISSRDRAFGQDADMPSPRRSRRAALVGSTSGSVLLRHCAIRWALLCVPLVLQAQLANNLPLRLAADQHGENALRGKIAVVRLYDRLLGAEEVASLARSGPAAPGAGPGCIAAWNLGEAEESRVSSDPSLAAQRHGRVTAQRLGDVSFASLEGGYYHIPDQAKLRLEAGAIEAWIWPEPGAIGRIADRITPGGSDGWLLDIFPADSVRLIVGGETLSAPLPRTGRWMHVVGLLDSAGRAALFVDGQRRGGGAQDDGLAYVGTAPAPQRPLTLWYRHPARRWTEALVMGNGRLGAMLWGGPRLERIDLNEDTLWSGEPYDNLNTNGLRSLADIRSLLLAGKNAEAQTLVEQHMNGQYNQCYMPLGQLELTFEMQGEVRNYRRQLDLATGVATVEFEHQGVQFRREAFVSQPDRALVVRLSADQPGALRFRATLDSQLRHELKAAAQAGAKASSAKRSRTLLQMLGRVPVHADPHYLGRRITYDDSPQARGMRFGAELAASHRGGTLRCTEAGWVAEGCDEVTLVLAAATSYNGPHRSPSQEGRDPVQACEAVLRRWTASSFTSWRARHVADHARLFDRVQLDVGRSERDAWPTDVRIKQYQPGQDPGLAALYYQFARYLLIAGSRPGTQPLNLQGIWNKDMNPAWSANWTLNCNAQINYWPVEAANLAECHEPLVDLTTELSVDGAHIARALYGARGWIAHHNTDLWRQAGPVSGSACWSVFQGGSAWLCQHLWEHYAFSLDEHYLRRIWPVLAGAARFYLDAMVKEPGHGWLVTAPDVNFENAFKKPDGSSACSCFGPTATMQMVRELFRNCLAAEAVLRRDPALRAELEAALPQLAPMQISPTTGELQEWVEDWQRTAACQVLSSWGAVCSAQITPRQTPELAAGLRRIFDRAQWWKEGAVGSWQGAFQANVYARMHEGDTALQVLDAHLQRVVNPNLSANFSGMAEWEIDGNMGLAAAVGEMLLQSHAGEVELLPALPRAWPNGSVRGLRARGGFEVGLAWAEGRLRQATIRAARGGVLTVRYGDRVMTRPMARGETYAWSVP